ncbi:kynurenine formamidase [Deinococcus sp. KSM4-11]|uniref:cyclase family protein n=1 Tax=Deinococcus sp. KSM4-11 TaxID=2568654 RepID=UPI0010A48163|nr:cyclase family protein [Deinococcus sp. KSM4-11]THF85819.1 kynurenine formamidase [Deinococcus sp. KSM4-11]
MTPSFPLDISRTLTPGHPNWPGDAPFVVEPGLRMAGGDTVNTGILRTSTHTGTHVDAPWHYDAAGARLHELPLDVWIGPCRVIDVRGAAEDGLVPAHVLDDLPDVLPPRLLLHTGQPAHWMTFPGDFVALSPALVVGLARRGVRLIGTDSPSVDPLESKTLDAHAVCRETGTFILEGLNLSAVPGGDYTLVCLPLPLHGADGAPARAILLPAGTATT